MPGPDSGRGPVEVRLFGRPGCHLCDEARATVLALEPELGPFSLVEVDIERDEALHAAYLERIPVIEVGGVVVSELELAPEDLRAFILSDR